MDPSASSCNLLRYRSHVSYKIKKTLIGVSPPSVEIPVNDLES